MSLSMTLGGSMPSTLPSLTVGTLEVTGAATFAATVTATGQFLAAAGSVGAPSYSFSGYPDNGWYMAASNSPALAVQGISVFRAGWNFLWIPSDTIPLLLGAAQDIQVYRDAADVLALRREANAQAFRVYETYTDASNYRRLSVSGNGLTLSSLGTGVAASGLYIWNGQAGSVEFATTNTVRWIISASGHWLASTDNTYDIGASGATRPRSGYFGANVYVDGGFYQAGVKVLGAQGAAVADASGGATVDAEARTAINTLLARMRTHGAIAT